MKVFTEEVQKGCQFAFKLTESNSLEIVEPLRYFAGRVETIVMGKVIDGGKAVLAQARSATASAIIRLLERPSHRPEDSVREHLLVAGFCQTDASWPSAV